MKRLISTFALLLFSPALFGGATYRFSSVTTGVASQTLDGVVKTEAGKMRVELASGDGVLFKNGSVVLSTDGGKTLIVAEPATKSWYALDLSDLLGGASAVTRQFGDAVKFDVKNPRVGVKHSGKTAPLEKLPTNRSTINSAYDLIVNAMGQNMTMKMQNATEVWWTDKLSAEYTNFLQLRGVRTGIDAVDKILAAQTASLKGFPLKQVTTTTVTMNGNTMKTTTTSSVSGFKQASFTADQFVLPPGYTKTDNPIEKMMKRFATR